MPKQLLLFSLYLLLWFTVADLLRVIHHTAEPRAMVFYAVSALLLLLMTAAAAAPLRFAAVLQRIKASGSARQCTKFNLLTKKPGSKRSAP